MNVENISLSELKQGMDVVIITGHPEKADQVQASVSGCLYKPFEIDKIFSEIDRVKKLKGL